MPLDAPNLSDTGSLTDPGVTARRLLFVMLSLIQILPIWAIRYAPLPDIGAHLAAASIWHNYYDPNFDLQRYYTLSLGLNPYCGYYVVLHLLAFPFGIDVANRLVLSGNVLSIPIGMWWLARRFDRSEWLSVAAFPFAWTMSFNYGFMPCSLGFALVPLGLALFDRYCERPGAGSGALAVLCGTTIYFFHILPWGLYLAAGGLIGLLHRGRSLRRIGGRLLVWLTTVVIGVIVTRFGSGKGMGRGTLTFTVSGPDALGTLARTFFDWVWTSFDGHQLSLLAGPLGF